MRSDHAREVARALYRKKIERGTCANCGCRPPSPGKLRCDQCRSRHNEYERKKHPNRRVILTPEQRKEKRRTASGRYRNKNPKICAKRTIAIHLRERLQVLAHYGAVCVCCGETRYEFLTLDHKNNDGAEHRRQVGAKIYHWVIKNHFPANFQILCMNCNWAKGRYGECPHEYERRQDAGIPQPRRKWEEDRVQ